MEIGTLAISPDTVRFSHYGAPISALSVPAEGLKIMDASKLLRGSYVAGRRVRQVVDTHETLWVRRAGRRVADGTYPVRKVTFDDGSTAVYALERTRAVRSGEPVPGAPGAVRSRLAGSAHRVRVTVDRVPSGRLGELTTWKHDQLTRMTGWDAASVNGRVGV